MKIKVIKRKYRKSWNGQGRARKYPLHEMEPGQCMVITPEEGENLATLRASAAGAASFYQKNNKGTKFASEIDKEKNVARIYRVA